MSQTQQTHAFIGKFFRNVCFFYFDRNFFQKIKYQFFNYFYQYADANNLYGLCQEKKLPCGNFKFEEIDLEKAMEIISAYDNEDSKGYIFKIDLVYNFN